MLLFVLVFSSSGQFQSIPALILDVNTLFEFLFENQMRRILLKKSPIETFYRMSPIPSSPQQNPSFFRRNFLQAGEVH